MDNKQTFAVTKIGPWGPSKINQSNVRLITFKDLNTSNTFKMYDDDLFSSSLKWRDLKVGDLVQDVSLLESRLGYVDARSGAKIIKK